MGVACSFGVNGRVLDGPGFAPLYRCGNTIGHSPLELILDKGTLRINPLTEFFWDEPGRAYCAQGYFVDLEIERVRPVPLNGGGRVVGDCGSFVAGLSASLILIWNAWSRSVWGGRTSYYAGVRTA